MEGSIDLLKRYWVVLVTFSPEEGEKGEVILTTDDREKAKHHDVLSDKKVLRFDADARRFL